MSWFNVSGRFQSHCQTLLPELVVRGYFQSQRSKIILSGIRPASLPLCFFNKGATTSSHFIVRDSAIDIMSRQTVAEPFDRQPSGALTCARLCYDYKVQTNYTFSWHLRTVFRSYASIASLPCCHMFGSSFNSVEYFSTYRVHRSDSHHLQIIPTCTTHYRNDFNYKAKPN